ncbi:hypothetical protein QJS10_CPB11g01038 [Acorus calamus]|uniref:Uncharacterized protein n=1 Tax=Acorus calamus TaxID=4465 RepID=A0AAV9DPY5_ACOCL|nr:hypothetical protein QJS10_CPB11g01038 [Acorus calamus]
MMQKTIVTKNSGKPDPMRRTSGTSKPLVVMVEEQKKRREEEKKYYNVKLSHAQGLQVLWDTL